MWFCYDSNNSYAYVGDTPEEAWEAMEENHNVNIEDCEFYYDETPKEFTLKLTLVNPKEN